MKKKTLILTMLLSLMNYSFCNETPIEVYDFKYYEGVSEKGVSTSSVTSAFTIFTAGALAVGNHFLAMIPFSSYTHCARLYVKHKDIANQKWDFRLNSASAYFEYMTACLVKVPTVPVSATADFVSSIKMDGPVASTRELSSDLSNATSNGLDGEVSTLAATQQEALEQLAAVAEGIELEMPMATALIDYYMKIHNVEGAREDVALYILENV